MTPVFSGDVLIVEDNFIIAMDAEMLVTDLGACRTHITNNTKTALQTLDRATIGAAILDFNLDDETSVRVADRLIEQSIPFVFATGYSDISLLPERFQDHVMLKKPYTKSDIQQAFLRLKNGGTDG